MTETTNHTTTHTDPSRRTTRWLALPLLVGALAVAACDVDVDFDMDDGPTVEQAFDLPAFDSIDIDAPFEVTIRQGTVQSVVIEIGERRLDDLQVEVADGELMIDLDGMFWGTGDLIASITVTDLERLTIESAADVVLASVDVDDLDVRVTGASQLRTSGAIDQLDLQLSGASNAEFDGTSIDGVSLDMSGASSAEFPSTVSRIEGSMSGASSLDVDDETVTSIDTSGASSIDRS